MGMLLLKVEGRKGGRKERRKGKKEEGRKERVIRPEKSYMHSLQNLAILEVKNQTVVCSTTSMSSCEPSQPCFKAPLEWLKYYFSQQK